MSSEYISEAAKCQALTCPANGESLPTGCVIPYNSTIDEYCKSRTIGLVSQYLVVGAIIVYMLAVGASMDWAKVKHAAKSPKPAIVGLFCQIVLNPLMMFALIAAFGSSFPVATKVMAILVSAAPGGTSSNLLSVLAYGDVEISVMMTVVSTFFAFATMPFYVWFATSVIWRGETADLTVNFVAIILAALTCTLLPLIGFVLKEKFGQRFGFWLTSTGSIVGVVASLAIGLLYLLDPLFRSGLAGLGWQVWVCCVLLNAAGLTMGYLASRLCRFPTRFHRTIAFEVGSQNVAIALAIVAVSFGSGPVGSLFTPFLGAYLITSSPINLSMMAVWRFGFPLEPHTVQDGPQNGPPANALENEIQRENLDGKVEGPKVSFETAAQV
mmetsp:Transcript_12900/g.20869  ORF Transcript_12900/g.20869 Transcript_12900/m.20869 type:complete len:383 (-) Transcript_12900:708-1856(-)|eukprot:CAMPEP_0203758678 /NCGR_PEP_ID=MMETSP0098-20131031/11518_1 /ASSEMBLY_ACC=CAM_ASM_000208 /TAXON_ID=96639 /ORGANISM=" , Strain NY0313808BC1" /LENGTH=382 /DNA_ID=CAMNT_0050651221 /DNA_START=540 /DNA_END=1688 /DNA_ORIENTATION=+